MADYEFVRPGTLSSRFVIVLTVVAIAFVAAGARAQSASPPPTSVETQRVADGWTALRQGNLPQASQIAQQLIADFPRSAAVVALAVEIDVRRGGPLAGLSSYERWLGARRVDDPYALRRIAQAHLETTAANPSHPGRLEAARALAADGGVDARGTLAEAAANGGAAETQVLASLGDPRAVRDLVAQLRADGGGKARIIEALAESRSPLAVAPLVELLKDSRDQHRAAAADALGRLGMPEAIPSLRPLLNDPVFPVQVAAAAALYRLEDYAGMNLLEQLMGSEHAAVRLGAAEAISVRPTGNWHAVVRELTRQEDATVQLGAARLIAPYEPQLAAEVLARLGQSDNPAVREEAGLIVLERLAADFATLRKFLRSPDPRTSVRAAARILALTR